MPSEINLLPSKERGDKKDKMNPVVIEMTKPDTLEAPKKKTGGVIQFFKGVFRRPKPVAQNASFPKYTPPQRQKQSAAAPAPSRPQIKFSMKKEKEATVVSETPVSAEAPFQRTHTEPAGSTVQPEFHPVPPPPPIRPQQASVPPTPQKKTVWVPQTPPARIPPAPAYRPVEAQSPKKEVVVQKAPKKQRPLQPKGPSLWSRFTAWFKKMFAPRMRPSVPAQIAKQPIPPLSRPPAVPFPPVPPRAVVPPPAAAVAQTPFVPPVPPQKPPQSPVSAEGQPPRKKEMQEAPRGYTDAPVLEKGKLRNVNLVPLEILDVTQPRRRLMQIGLAVAASLMVVIFAYLGLFIYQRMIVGQTASIDKQIATVNGQIKTFDTFRTQSETLRRHIDDVTTLINSHVHWGAFFTLLEQNTLPDVYYTSIAVDTAGTVSLNAVGKDNVTVARQYVLLKHATDFATDATISSLSPMADPTTGKISGYNFTIAIHVAKSLFIQK